MVIEETIKVKEIITEDHLIEEIDHLMKRELIKTLKI